ncbi:MAG: hypothetical protein V3W41_20490 [Planctomycetota bacterium]
MFDNKFWSLAGLFLLLSPVSCGEPPVACEIKNLVVVSVPESEWKFDGTAVEELYGNAKEQVIKRTLAPSRDAFVRTEWEYYNLDTGKLIVELLTEGVPDKDAFPEKMERLRKKHSEKKAVSKTSSKFDRWMAPIFDYCEAFAVAASTVVYREFKLGPFERFVRIASMRTKDSTYVESYKSIQEAHKKFRDLYNEVQKLSNQIEEKIDSVEGDLEGGFLDSQVTVEDCAAIVEDFRRALPSEDELNELKTVFDSLIAAAKALDQQILRLSASINEAKVEDLSGERLPTLEELLK